MTNQMSLQDTLLAYSEWLDGEKLMARPEDQSPPYDQMSHQDLAEQFLEHWNSDPNRALLRPKDIVSWIDPSENLQLSRDSMVALPSPDQKVVEALNTLLDHEDANIQLGAARMILDLRSVTAAIRRDEFADGTLSSGVERVTQALESIASSVADLVEQDSLLAPLTKPSSPSPKKRKKSKR